MKIILLEIKRKKASKYRHFYLILIIIFSFMMIDIELNIIIGFLVASCVTKLRGPYATRSIFLKKPDNH